MMNILRPRTALFADRVDAGLQLAQKLSAYAGRTDVVVLGLPRGGVPVAAEVAKELRAPLDIFLVRKLGVPGHEELAMGAIASGGVQILNQDVVQPLRIPMQVIDRVAAHEQQELARREQLYRSGHSALQLEGRTVILVDDGLATGASMSAAVAGLRTQHPAQIVVAVPTAAPETCEMFEDKVDEIVCAETPQPFMGVGFWYENFNQTTDDEVRRLLEEVRQMPYAQRAESPSAAQERQHDE
ncbi:MAG: phosphoribosyltransferase [Caldilineaceae bacterium]